MRIIVPLKYDGDNEEKRTRELNMIHRVLLKHLKAKFIAIAKGLTEFETEFIAHLVIMDKNANSRTMGDALLPEYRRTIEEGKRVDFKLLSDGNETNTVSTAKAPGLLTKMNNPGAIMVKPILPRR